MVVPYQESVRSLWKWRMPFAHAGSWLWLLQARVVSDIDEIELEKQLAKLEEENREVAGDSDEGDEYDEDDEKKQKKGSDDEDEEDEKDGWAHGFGIGGDFWWCGWGNGDCCDFGGICEAWAWLRRLSPALRVGLCACCALTFTVL